jgi:hypothetical protein
MCDMYTVHSDVIRQSAHAEISVKFIYVSENLNITPLLGWK